MATSQRLKKIAIKSGKIIGWTFLSVLMLLIVIIIAIRIPAVQNRIVQAAVSFVQDKIGTPVSIKSIVLSFPKKIVISELYLEDQSRDTLLYAREISVDADMWALLNNTIEINTFQLEGSSALIRRSKQDSSFNFDYIIKAFASSPDTIKVDTTSSTPWKFNIESVEIVKTHLKYQDQIAGDNIELLIGDFAIDIDEFNLDSLRFGVSEVSIRDTRAFIVQSPIQTATKIASADTTASKLPDIDVRKVRFDNVQMSYDNAVSRQKIELALGELKVDANDIDLNKKVIDIDDFEMNETSIVVKEAFSMDESSVATTDSAKPTAGDFTIPWKIRVSSLALGNNTFCYDIVDAPVAPKKIDFNHLLVSFLNIKAKDVVVENENIKLDLQKTSFRERSGFSIEQLSTALAVTQHEFDLKNFTLKTGYSSIEIQGNARYESISDFLSNYQTSNLSLDARKASLSLRDARFFVPEVIDSMGIYVPASAMIDADLSIRGTVKNLDVRKLNIKIFDSTTVSFHGKLNGLPEIRNTRMNVVLDRFYTTGYDMKLILPDTLLPDSIRLPKWVELTGDVKGTFLTPETNLILKSDVGGIDVDGSFDFNNIPKYKATIATKQLNVGRILRSEESMGLLDLKADVDGSGNQLQNLDARLNVAIERFEYNKYEYKNVILKGAVKKFLFDGEASVKDDNLDLSIVGNLNRNDSVPTYNLKVVLANGDFQALKLSDKPLKARATVDVNLRTTDFKAINGNMDIRKVAIFNGKTLYTIDSLLFVSLDQNRASSFSIRSDVITGDFSGTFNLFTLPKVMKQYVNQYFSLQDNTITEFKDPQKFKFDLTIKNTALITEILLPELDSFTPGTISGAFNSETDSLRMDVNLSAIKYGTTGIDSLAFRVRSDNESLNYSVRVKNIALDTVRVDAIQLVGKIAHDSIYTALQVLDSVNAKKYTFGGVVRSEQTRFRFHLIPGQVLLNYKDWTVPPDNYLEFGGPTVNANNFSISRSGEKVAVVTDAAKATIALEFTTLQLANLTHIIAGKVPVSGILDGDFKITTASQGEFDSKLKINELALFGKPVGELSFAVDHSNDRYNLELLVNGDGSKMRAAGYYISKPTSSEFNVDVSFDPLNFRTIEPFTFGHIIKSSGSINGNIKLTGTTKEPSIRGAAGFNNASFVLRDVNSTFNLENEKISFEESGIAFKDFTIKDEKNNRASVNGSILTKYYKDFEFDLRVNSKDFQLLNTQEGELFYGLVKITTRTRISGTTDHPVINMTINPSDDTNFTYVIPQEAKTALEQQGIISWRDRDFVKDPFLASITSEDSVEFVNNFGGIDLTANIELNDKAVFNIVIDPLTGDKLSVQGNSTLVFGIDHSGDMSLSGRYEITKGSYDFSFYKFVKRQFMIEKGGSITWSGDVMRADMDIRASFLVETSPLELISNQVTSAAEATTYKQVLPFLVYLNIKGQLLTPEISFALSMPENKQGVFGGSIYARLQDINTRESELNKQVFALLILKRFIADNPLQNSAEGGLANTARQSVSRILSDQLNRLADNVKGVDLTFDIKSLSDYSTASTTGTPTAQTRLQLGVQKTAFNDRLVVKLAGNVNIEGQNTNTSNSAANYIGDLALEYKLTEDGRLRITGFRNSNFDMIAGELVETGAGVIYIKDYNTLKELFKPDIDPQDNAEKRAERRKRRDKDKAAVEKLDEQKIEEQKKQEEKKP